MDYGFIFGYNTLIMNFLQTQLFTSQDYQIINLWIIEVFLISCLGSLSDSTHSPQGIDWWAGDVMLNYSKLFWGRKQLIHLGWPGGGILVNDSFKKCLWWALGMARDSLVVSNLGCFRYRATQSTEYSHTLLWVSKYFCMLCYIFITRL